MPTTEERLDTLEQQMSELQAISLTHPTISQVYQVLESHDTYHEGNDSDHNLYDQRLSALERAVSQFRGLLSGLNADGTIVKNNYSATAGPIATNDNTEGYSVGSTWINVTADDAYIALDVSTGAAVWKQTTP